MPAPSPPFQSSSFIWERRDVMFCCFCKRGASDESPLCTGLCCEHCQKGEGRFFIWHLFPTCFIGWEIHSKNKRQFWPPFFVCFSWEPSQYGNFLCFWGLLTFYLLHWKTILQHDNNAIWSLAQSGSTNKLTYAVYTVCMLKSCSWEFDWLCFCPCVAYCKVLVADGKVAKTLFFSF